MYSQPLKAKKPKMKMSREHITLEFEPEQGQSIKRQATNSVAFKDVAILPAPGDNVAICTKRLEKGLILKTEGQGDLVLSNTVSGSKHFRNVWIPHVKKCIPVI